MKIEVFVRHCFYSQVSAKKKRPKGFTHQKCHENLMQTASRKKVNFTFLLDTHFAGDSSHFIQEQTRYPVLEFDGGTETAAFLMLLDYVEKQNFSDDTILYFLEDDYIHRPGWVEVMREGFSLPGVDYLTLFDHRDKYFLESFQELQSKVYHTQTCHWRTTPSTTNTYAMRAPTLIEDLPLHQEFSQNRKISADHEKFLALGEKGRVLISSIPGFSTHAEPEYSSPCVSWDDFGGWKTESFPFSQIWSKLVPNTGGVQ